MRHLQYMALVVLFFTSLIQAQIENAGFEQWTGVQPLHWYTTNEALIADPIKPNEASYSGSFAAQGEVVVSVPGDTVIPVMVSGESASGFPVDQAFTELTGYFQFDPKGHDVFLVGVIMYNTESLLGVGTFVFGEATNAYTRFTVPIQYFAPGQPEWCFIEITAGDTAELIAGTPGTKFMVDDLVLSGVTGIVPVGESGVARELELRQNFPNPFNPSTTISFRLPVTTEVSLAVYNTAGEEVAQLLNRQSMNSGEHSISWNAGNQPSGVYLYRLTADGKSLSGKMMLLK